MLADIQGFLTSGYGHLPLATYLFVEFQDRARAQAWLEAIAPAMMTSAPWPVAPDGTKIKPTSAINLAVTAAGLAALGLPPRVLCSFPIEFQEDIARPDRSAILGDTDESAPAHWEIGGPDNPPIHALVIVHAASAPDLDAVCRAQRRFLDGTAQGVRELPGGVQSGYRAETNREPFGFHDGIGQPSIQGVSGNGVPTGEFILGYPNHYGIVAPTPVVGADLEGASILPPLENPYHAHEGLRDLGRNGSYVVYRKLAGCRRFLAVHEARSVRARGSRIPPTWSGWRRCVGRWPSGAPLALTPDTDSPGSATETPFSTKTTRTASRVRSAPTCAASTRATSSSRTRTSNRSACRRPIVSSGGGGCSARRSSIPASSTPRRRRTAGRRWPRLATTARRAASTFSA
jgi:deferrochelatase/peroxidase EfeB